MFKSTHALYVRTDNRLQSMRAFMNIFAVLMNSDTICASLHFQLKLMPKSDAVKSIMIHSLTSVFRATN